MWRSFRFTGDWQTLTVPRKDIRFGWGLSPTNRLEKITRIEFALSAGEGGAGRVLLDDFNLRELPAGPPEPVMTATASSEENKDGAARFAVDGIYSTRWWSKPFDPQWIQLDLGAARRIAGLGLIWGNHGDYEVLLSDDGAAWRTVYVQEDADGGRDDIYFAESEARFVIAVPAPSSRLSSLPAATETFVISPGFARPPVRARRLPEPDTARADVCCTTDAIVMPPPVTPVVPE